MPQSIAVIDPSIVSKKKEKKQVDYRVGKKLKHVTRNIITCRKKGSHASIRKLMGAFSLTYTPCFN
jgi:hypothetical protein